jgi:hypothetical protein
MVERATQFVTGAAPAAAFVLLPLGVLTASNGVLAALKSRGAAVTALA